MLFTQINLIFVYLVLKEVLMLADDEVTSDIWYNISHVAICIGLLSLAYQALKICLDFSRENFGF